MADIQSVEQLLRHHFLGWQCRIRQHAVRMQDGKPTPGMFATILINDELVANLIVIINQKEVTELITEFQYLYKKTHDPAIRRSSILKILVSGYFQQAEDFSDRLTASVSQNSEVANRILQNEKVMLVFEQQNQRYSIPCVAKELDVKEEMFQVTYWHNALFNPNLPPTTRIVAFNPLWKQAIAEPMPNQAVPNTHTYL